MNLESQRRFRGQRNRPQREVETYDSENGFRRIYHSIRGQHDYSLLVVPERDYFRLKYTKPIADIDFSLELVDGNSGNLDWLVLGTIDSDIFAQLGLQVDSRRRGQTPPQVSAENLVTARAFGAIAEAGVGSRSGIPLYNSAIELPPTNIVRFFSSVWQPWINQAYRDTRIPRIRVGIAEGEDRVLPQKIATSQVSKNSSLIIYSH